MTDLTDTVAALTHRLDEARPYNIGFPGATDLDYTPLADLLTTHLLNNVGDPWIDGLAANHTKAFEREVVWFLADLFRAPTSDRWGYVTTGGSEGNLYPLWLARTLYPDGLLLRSAAAHASVAKAADVLRMESIVVRTGPTGEMDYDDLADQITRHRHRPAVILATAGTTLTEAVDDVRRIGAVLDDLAVTRRYIHVDAALSGIPLALLDPGQRPGFDFADGADSLSVSGHKFLAAKACCGVVVVRASHRNRIARDVGYTGSPDATLFGSRSGHAPLMLWYALKTLGVDELRARAQAARELAAYTHRRLVEIGWEATRLPHAFTVVLRTPPPAVTEKWVLATVDEWSHIITMPGVARESIDAFLEDLAASPDVAGPSESTNGPARPASRTAEPAALVEA
jgi:histidine decarboxylase